MGQAAAFGLTVLVYVVNMITALNSGFASMDSSEEAENSNGDGAEQARRAAVGILGPVGNQAPAGILDPVESLDEAMAATGAKVYL